VTLIALASLRSHLGQTPHLPSGAMGGLRPVGAQAAVAEARPKAPAANLWSNQPLRSLMSVEFMLALGQRPRHEVA